MVPDLRWFNLRFSTLRCCESHTHSAETILRILIFSQASDMWFDTGQWQQATAPSQPRDHEGKQSIYLQPFCFSLSVQYSINYMRYSTRYYNIGFVLDDFAQLQANVSVLSTFNIG